MNIWDLAAARVRENEEKAARLGETLLEGEKSQTRLCFLIILLKLTDLSKFYFVTLFYFLDLLSFKPVFSNSLFLINYI